MNLESFFDTLLELATTIGVKILYAIVVLFIGLKLIKWLKKKLPNFNAIKRLDAGVQSFLISASTIVLYVLLFLSIAMILGIPTTSFIAALASCLAAIGLAMQGSLSNCAGGLMILMFKPFCIGDYISAPEQGVEGTVTKITVMYTVLRTYDNIEVTIPNGTLTNSVVKNISAADIRRLDLNFRVDPESDLEKVETVLAEVIAAEERVLAEPAPVTCIWEITDSALIYSIRVWVPGPEFWNARFAITRAVKQSFTANGIVMPHNQVDVHMEQDAATSTAREVQ